MDKNRAIAWALGIIVFLTMIMAVRSCSQSPAEKTSSKKEDELPELYINKRYDVSVQSGTGNVNTAPVDVDIFGRPITTTTVITEEVPEEETTTTLPPETDDFGNIITTVTTFETDIFGNIATTVTTFETDIFGNVVTTMTTTTTIEEISVATTSLSPFEQYQQDLDDPDSIGGFNHVKRDESGKPLLTAPNDIVIVIN